MHANDPRARPPRRRQPVLERLEAREVLSLVPQTHVAGSKPSSRPAEIVAHTDSPNGLLGSGQPGQFLNPRVIERAVNLLYGPDSATPMTPTPQEVRRQIFAARWIGQYTVGPPGFSDRASTIHGWSKTGGSNTFLKGKLNMVLFPPANPGATPDPGNPSANQVTGVAALFPQNLLQTGGLLDLDLNAIPGPGSNPQNLPTHLTWTYDSNSAAGPFVAPAGFTQGTGTLDIRWIPDAHPLAGTMGSGKVIVTFQGLINLSQISSAVSKFYS
jgi:hypothetical protein